MKSASKILLCLLLPVISFGQRVEYAQFNEYFLDAYAKAYEQPGEKYIDVLEAAAKKSFAIENPHYLNVLKEIKAQKRITDGWTALDTLIRWTFADLKKTLTLNEHPQLALLKTYNEAACGCTGKKIKPTDRYEKFTAALEQCDDELRDNKSFIDKITKLGSHEAILGVPEMQQLFLMYMYNNCIAVYAHVDANIRHTIVQPQYMDALLTVKIQEAEELFKLYGAKQYESLAALFPDYKKYTKELEQADELLTTEITWTSTLSARALNNKPGLTLTLFKGNTKVGVLYLSLAAYEADAVFTGLVVNPK